MVSAFCGVNTFMDVGKCNEHTLCDNNEKWFKV